MGFRPQVLALLMISVGLGLLVAAQGQAATVHIARFDVPLSGSYTSTATETDNQCV